MIKLLSIVVSVLLLPAFLYAAPTKTTNDVNTNIGTEAFGVNDALSIGVKTPGILSVIETETNGTTTDVLGLGIEINTRIETQDSQDTDTLLPPV